MRTINVTIKIEDKDHVEQKLYESLDGMLGSSMTDYCKLPDLSKYFESDTTFLKLYSEKKKAKQKFNDYINKLKTIK